MMRRTILVLLVWSCAVSAVAQLHVENGRILDAQGNVVVLQGTASMGMAMVYGDRDNPGTYVPMTPAQYIDRALQTDATGKPWRSNAIRLNFERFPSASPGRLYSVEGQPYAQLDTTSFPAWTPTTQYGEGDVRTSGGIRYLGAKHSWRADKGFAWNPGPWQVGDTIVSLLSASTHIYRCTKSTPGTGDFQGHWDLYPQGTTTFIEDEGAYVYEWTYVAEYGFSGTVPLSQLSPFGVTFGGSTTQMWSDGTMYWTRLSADYTQAQMDATFVDWKSKVLDPVVQHAIDRGLYVVICDFDFGPAHHPLRRARMLDFWTRMAKSQWKNHPKVLFELWNESEDIGSFAGGPGSWAAQKPAIQETVNAVRALGANNIILIPPPFYSSWVGEATADPIVGTNLAYTLHQYRSQWEAYQSNRAQIQQGLASGQAIVMTEWGDDVGGTDSTQLWPTYSSVLPALKDLLAPTSTGWFAWSLSQVWTPALFSDRALTTPTMFGVAARDWLASVTTPVAPGTPTGFRITP